MKKLLLLFIIISFIPTSLFSQSLKLMKADGSGIFNDTIYLKTDNGSATIEAPVYVKNTSSKKMDVLVKTYVKNLVSGSGVSYCWGSSCYDISTSPSTSHTSIEASDTAKEFHSDYVSNDQVGVTEIMYTFYNENNIVDSVSITVYYELYITGISKLTEIRENISSYPNPVQNTLFIDYKLGNDQIAEVAIYDIVGKRLKTRQVYSTESLTEFDLSDLKTGIYIWSFEINGIPVKTEKIIKN